MFTLLFAATLTFQGPSVAPVQADQVGRGYYLFLQGLTLESANDVAGAIDSYRQASALLPKAAEIRTALAGLYVRQNQIAEAKREAEAALALDSDNRDAHRLLGGIQTLDIENATSPVDRSAVQEAIDHLERAVAGGPTDERVELALSSLYLRMDKAQEAIGRLQKVLEDYPDYPPAIRLLVRAYEAAGQAEDAASLRERLGAVRPDTTEIRVRGIERLEHAGRWADAAAAWNEIFENDPGSAIYRTRYAAALANSGRVQEARRVLLDATREAPRDSASWYLLAVIEARSGNTAAAEAAAQQVIQLDPKDSRGPLALARARMAGKNYRGAVQALESRVNTPAEDDIVSGAYVEMAAELGRAYTLLGQRKKGLEVLEHARRAVPSNEELLFQLAAGYEQNRNYEKAEQAFRDLIQLNGSHADGLNYLGYMLADRSQKLPEAVQFISRALAIDPDNPSYLDSLGWAHFRLGQYEQAREPLERAATALPQSSVVQEHLGDLYVQLKRYDDAVKAYDRALSGDRDGLDTSSTSKKRDRARGAAGGK